ncbi:MAG: TonB-dependent receptor [candidate division Zixibacteria bacterium]|nr:TonB-dependent receptor [candidate division Zixibacteria bacterium]MBU2625184.1 TonB-dependent receptor [candidate division Zixibacteria bacterium]
MFHARRAILVLVATVVALLSVSAVQAAVTGKITGVVVDKRSGDALPSVAVQIAGTSQGALTTVDGDYLILNVSPGTYSITFKLVGYHTMQVDEVQVITGRTAQVNVELESTTLESDIVQRVIGQRDVMEMENPRSSVVFGKEQLQAMPVQDVDGIVAATVGVVKRYGELHIRGGRSGEVSYVVDGVETKDPLGGLGPTDAGMNLSSNTIEEIQIIKGGFDPEFGRAMSGIVTVSTKTGSVTTEGHIELYTDNFRAPNLNTYSNKYDRLYFSLGGPEPLFARNILPALGVDYFKDKLFYFFSVDVYKTDGAYAYDEYTSPSRQRNWREHDILGLTLRDRQQNSFSMTAKMTYKVTNNLKMVFNYQGIWKDETVFSWKYRYTPETAPIGNDMNERLSLSMTHQLSKSTFYEIVLSRVYHEYVRKPDDPAHPGAGISPDQFRFRNEWESFTDRNGNGVYDAPEPFINVYGDTSYAYGGEQYNFGDVFIPDTLASYAPPGGFGWDNHHPYLLYDPWFGDSIRYDEKDPLIPWRNQQDFVDTYVDTILWDWSGNGLIDFDEGEPFVDVNNNGRWDRGDQVKNDQNGNNRFDRELGSVVGLDVAEPFTDGDVNLGEPFHDYNNNGVFDYGIDVFTKAVDPLYNQDLNHNGKHDGRDAPWTPGIPYRDLNGNGIYDLANNAYDAGEPFVDANGNGKWDGNDGFLDYGYHVGSGLGEDPHYQENSSNVWTADFKITKQLVREHELKTGFQLRFLELEFAEITGPWDRASEEVASIGGPYSDRGSARDFYKHDPVEGAFFIQDIVEYGSLVARVGLRYDFFFQSDGVDTLIKSYAETGRDVVSSRGKLSPRVGVSYPITEKAKIYFNYGHFYQLPEYVNMYQRLGQNTGILGNPNLDFGKTVQYEFGVRYNLSGDYVLDISGFYKDIFGIINSSPVYEGTVTRYSEYQNNDYGRTRGFEIELAKKYGNFVSGYMSYTYAFAYGKASSENSNFEDLVAHNEIPIQEYPLDWDVRHAITLNFDLRISRADHPKLFGYSIPNDWGVNVLWQWSSGLPFTPAANYPGLTLQAGEKVIKNGLRKPSSSTVDIRFNKNFSAFSIDYSFEVWVENVFDNRNIQDVHTATGRADTSNNLNGVIRGGNDFDKIPWWTDPGRNVRLGLTVNF